MAAQYKVFDRMRHPRAFEVARQRGTASSFSGFPGARQCLLVTFKRSGEPVPTPVNFGLSADGGRLYFRAEPHVAKIRRLRNNPQVRVCPCNLRGKPTGDLVEATARVLPETENEQAFALIDANYRPETRILERGYDRIGVPVVYVEVVPARPA
jgi:PPOX class probable F420-dependent enzyme